MGFPLLDLRRYVPPFAPWPSPLSFIPLPNGNSFDSMLMTRLLLPDLTPNVGLWWYFFIEMFDSFRSFFLVVFQLHLLVYVAPLCIRLKRKPLAVLTTLLGIISIFKSYPSVADLSVYLGMLSLHTEIFSRILPIPMEPPFFLILFHLISSSTSSLISPCFRQFQTLLPFRQYLYPREFSNISDFQECAMLSSPSPC